MRSNKIIVLGGGIEHDGSLPEIPRRRVERGVELCQSTTESFLILSGKWGFLSSFTPPRTEAQAMKEYAISLGMPANTILVEKYSMDTVGNAYFLKTEVLEPKGWKDITMVTSEYHVQRASYIFHKVFGSGYAIHFISADSRLSALELKMKQVEEHTLLEFTRRHLDHVADGDHAPILQLLMQFPGYSDSPKYSKEDLLKLILTKR